MSFLWKPMNSKGFACDTLEVKPKDKDNAISSTSSPAPLKYQPLEKKLKSPKNSIEATRPPLVSKPQNKLNQQHHRRLLEIFKQSDINADNKLSLEELKKVLQNTDKSEFKSDTIEFLFNLHDIDGNRYLDFREFFELWSYITSYREVFKKIDKNNHDYINLHQFGICVKEHEYGISDQTIEYVFDSHAESDSNAPGVPPVLKLDSFICAFRMISEVDKLIDSSNCSTANDECLQLTYKDTFEFLLTNI